jgi:hypothetical protein
MADLGWVVQRVEGLKARHAKHKQRVAEVAAVRRGDWAEIAGEMFSDEIPRPIVSNQIDILARHAQAALSPLPVITCQTTNSANEAARKRADRRTKIAMSYLRRGRVESRMQSGADQFYTYGLVVGVIEVTKDGVIPLIEDSAGIYPVWDRTGKTVAVARVFRKPLVDLIAEFPEHEMELVGATRSRNGAAFTGSVEVTKYEDANSIVMYVTTPVGSSGKGQVVLVNERNPLGKCRYVAVKRASLDDEIRGVFVQLAKHLMQTYMLSATEQAVNAPFAVPTDVQELAFGPNEVIRSESPEKIRRIAADVPPAAWAAVDYLKKEIDSGAISPEALNGSIDASVVTGKGVQQLMAGYSQQIAMAQDTLVGFFEQLLCLCFEMDEKVFPDTKRNITGTIEGQAYSVDYTPAKDIAGDYDVHVAYGGVAGLDPNRSLVLLLQAQTAGLISRDYARRNLPVSDMDPADEETKVQVEALRGSLIAGVSGLPQLMPQIMAQGGDPMTFIMATAKSIDLIQKGIPVEEAVPKAFAPPKQESAPAPTPEQQAAQAAGGAGGGPTLQAAGLSPNNALASRGPNAKADLLQMFAGNTASGGPNLQAGVSRLAPAS